MLEDNKISKYFLYAIGEILLVMIGILLALQVNNWNQQRNLQAIEMKNLETLYTSFNENMQIEPLIQVLEEAIRVEKAWIDRLESGAPLTDTLLEHAFFIGITSRITPNMGFYESLKNKGLETIENLELRNRISITYEQHFPELNASMRHFEDRFGRQRLDFFRQYFEIDIDEQYYLGVNQYHFDHAMYGVEQVNNLEELEQDAGFLEFVKISYAFHRDQLLFCRRMLNNIYDVSQRANMELSHLKYGDPKKEKVTIRLEGYQDKEEVFVTGEFNNWRASLGRMERTRDEAWEYTIRLFPGQYEYKLFIPPDTWITDPSNPDSVFVPEVDNYNSILTIE